MELFQSAVPVTHLRLTGKKDFAAVDTLQSNAHLYFTFAVVAVCRCYVVVINAALEGILNSFITAVLLVMAKGQPRKTYDRDFLAGPTEQTSRQAGDFFDLFL